MDPAARRRLIYLLLRNGEIGDVHGSDAERAGVNETNPTNGCVTSDPSVRAAPTGPVEPQPRWSRG